MHHNHHGHQHGHHCHHHGLGDHGLSSGIGGNGANSGARRAIAVVLVLNLTFAIVEFIGGWLTGSVAIFSDAMHDFGDTLSLGLALILENAAAKRSSPIYSYGMRRLSLLSSFVLAIVLIASSCIVLAAAWPRLWQPVQPKAGGMIGLAVLGIAANGLGAWILSRGKTLNQKVLSWHLIEDLLGWVLTLVAAVVMLFGNFPILDPLLAIVFSGWILFGVLKSLRSIVRLFLQGTPPEIDMKKLMGEIQKVPGVLAIHDGHLWSLDGEMHVFTLHVVVGAQSSLEDAARIRGAVRQIALGMGKIHTTVEIEEENESCPDLHCAANP